jgi:dephospho-CoA kinase
VSGAEEQVGAVAYGACVLTVGLTGGIGSGKSEVSRLLARHGAVVVDADLIAREVVEPGTPGLARLVAEFGAEVLRGDGTLDRPALGARVFADPAALARLNAIVHPLVGERTAELLREARASGATVVVHDVPLLVENNLADSYDAVVVVAARPQTQLDRLVRLRGLPEAEARQRLDVQAPLADKLAVATHVVQNDGPLEDLAPQVKQLWADLVALSQRAP